MFALCLAQNRVVAVVGKKSSHGGFYCQPKIVNSNTLRMNDLKITVGKEFQGNTRSTAAAAIVTHSLHCEQWSSLSL
jgi:hypothetical protein